MSGTGGDDRAVFRGVTRRDFGKLAALAAGATALGPVIRVAAQTPVASPAASPAASPTFAPSPDRPRGGSVTVPNIGDATTLDPILDTGPSYFAWNNIYDTLIGFTKELTYEGVLAESWSVSDDGLEYTFKIRQGVLFHDGTPLNAEAVKFSFDRILDPANKAVVIDWIGPLKGAEVVDEYTAKILLSEPFSPLLGSLCITSFGIVSPTAVKKYGADFGRNPVGTGAWKLEEWVSGESITFARNENYVNFHSYMENHGAPYLDELVFHILPDADTQMAAFETDEIQVVPVPPAQVEDFKQNPDYQVYIPTRNTGIGIIEFATLKPKTEYGAEFKAPFDDLRVRQALAYGIDVDTIIEKVLYGLAARNYGLMPNGLFAYNPEIEQFGYHFDADKAKSLLDDAGWTAGDGGVREKDGKKLEVLGWTYAGNANDKVLQVIQNQLNQIGFSVKIEVLEAATFIAQLVNGPANFWIDSWNWPEPNLMKMMTSVGYGISNYRNETFVTDLDQASKISDPDKRTALYFDANKQVLADCAAVPLWTDWSATAVRSEAKGYVLSPPRGVAAYEDMYVEK